MATHFQFLDNTFNSKILTCCRAQCLVAKYDPMEREACRLRHTPAGPIASYSRTKTAPPRDSLS